MFVSLERLAQQRRELDAQEAAWLRAVAEYDRSENWRAEGYGSAAAALRHTCNMNAGTARAHVDLARKLLQLPETAEAFGDGAISRQRARVIADAYTPERGGALARVEAPLVDTARRATPRELSSIVRRLTDTIDGDGGAASDEELFARRRMHMSRTLDGMLIEDGIYDPESAAIHEAAINAQLEREWFDGDTRSPTQRRADAVTALFRESLDRGQVGSHRAVRPHVTVVIDIERLPGAAPDLLAQVRADARDGGLSAATLERLACDCDVSRVITAGPSDVLDVGRATRTISAALWKALAVRDRHCRVRGCYAHPNQCEAHHIVHWSRGGRTCLENLELRCRRHHREAHLEEARRHTDAQPRAA
jgi:hypothetical protein